MIKTPMTDQREHRQSDGAPHGRVVSADFARALERDRMALIEAMDEFFKSFKAALSAEFKIGDDKAFRQALSHAKQTIEEIRRASY